MKNFIRETWLKLRLGYSSYFAYALAFTNLVILVSLRFDVTGFAFVLLAVGVFVGVSIPAIVIGDLHLKHQQPTDLRLEFTWQIDATAEKVVELLKKEKLVVAA